MRKHRGKHLEQRHAINELLSCLPWLLKQNLLWITISNDGKPNPVLVIQKLLYNIC